MPCKLKIGIAVLTSSLSISCNDFLPDYRGLSFDRESRGQGNITSHNLLSNPSFEADGQPSLTGWRWMWGDSSNTGFSSDAPALGGAWSLRFGNGYPFPPICTQSVSTPVGPHRYRFSIWAKAYGFLDGDAYVGVKTGDTITTRISVHVQRSDTAWTYYEFVGTISTGQSESLSVSLTTGFLSGTMKGASVWFDLCRLELLPLRF